MNLNLRHIIYYIYLAVFLLVTGGCINDHLDDCGTDAPVSVNTVGYMSMQLHMANAQTRVGDAFDRGENDEFALADGQHHYAIFYNNDEQETPMAIATLTNFSKDENEGDKKKNSSVVFATVVTKSQYKDMLTRLQECVVILNTDLKLDQFWTKTKDDLLNIVVSSPFYTNQNGKEYFTMCNSVFIENKQKVMASKVNTDYIYTSYIEAIEQAWKGNAAVEAYVERLAAKFSLGFKNEAYNAADARRIFTPTDNKMIVFSELNNDGIPYYDGSYSYQIEITGWGMNALEQESYLFRNINANGNYFDGWYRTDYNRAFWSEDLHYTDEVYPWQYRRAIDKADMPYYQEKGEKNVLRNLSYEELNATRFNKKYQYAPENTYDFTNAAFNSNLDNRAELLAGTHLIVCAELQTNINTENKDTYRSTDIYRDRNGNFYRSEKECFKALVAIFNNYLKSHSFLKYTAYDWDKGGREGTLFAWTKGEYYLYYNNTKLTPENIDEIKEELTSDAIISGGDGKRLIWLDSMAIKGENGEALDIYSNIDEVDASKNKKLRPATTSDYQSILWEWLGAVEHFQDGKMYYAIPVGYIKDEANSTAQSNKYSVYGVVRNSVYQIVIDDVTGLGTSVDKVTEPIVPNKVSTHDHLFISFDILDWHLTEQNVPGVIK